MSVSSGNQHRGAPQRPLTVVQLLPALESGGVERGTLELAAELVRLGHRSIVISAGGRLVAELLAGGSEHVSWPIGRKSLASLRFVARLRRFLIAEGVDILHARSRLPAWIGYLALRRTPPSRRPRFVTTVHGFYSVGRYSAVMTKGERVIAVSDAIAGYVRENYPAVEPQRITVIHRGVDRREFPWGFRPDGAWLEQWHRQFPQLRDRLVLTLPGRITRLKGHEDFLRLIARLRERDYPVHGLIVGGEDPRHRGYMRELRRTADELAIAHDLTFAGLRTDIREVFAVSRLVFSLSQKPESFGRTVLEALSLGVPVVAYEHGGVGEILRSVYPFGLTPLREHEQLVQKVETMLECAPPVPEQHPFERASTLAKTIDLYLSLRADARAPH